RTETRRLNADAGDDTADDLARVEDKASAFAVNLLGDEGADDRADSYLQGVGVFEFREFEGHQQRGGGLIEELIGKTVAVKIGSVKPDGDALHALGMGALDNEGTLARAGVVIAEDIIL